MLGARSGFGGWGLEEVFIGVWSDLSAVGEGRLTNPVWEEPRRRMGSWSGGPGHPSVVCKIAFSSVSAVDAKTKDARHSFVT